LFPSSARQSPGNVVVSRGDAALVVLGTFSFRRRTGAGRSLHGGNRAIRTGCDGRFCRKDFVMSTELRNITRWPDRVGEINRRSFLPLLGAGAVSLMLARNALAQQIPFPLTSAQVPKPVPGTAMTMDFVRMAGRTAYFWAIRSSPRSIVAQRSPKRPSACSSAVSYPWPRLATSRC
jgi:hypothetical protein